MVKTAAAAFAFLALFGTPIAAQFADAEEANSWFFLQRIARELEDIFYCASIVAAADNDLASFCRKRQDSAAESAFSAFFGGKFCLPVGGAMSLI
jgi:hypothetical protein